MYSLQKCVILFCSSYFIYVVKCHSALPYKTCKVTLAVSSMMYFYVITGKKVLEICLAGGVSLI